MNYNDQFKARNHIFMFMFSHRTFFQLLKTGYLSLVTFLALTSIFKYTTENFYIFKSVKSSSSIHNRHNRIHCRLLIYILTYIRQNVCYRSFILRTKDDLTCVDVRSYFIFSVQANFHLYQSNIKLIF